MSFAETFLLLNDEPSKPLNRHFDEAVENLKKWIIDSTTYITSDNVLFTMTGRETKGKAMTHSGVLTVTVAPSSSSTGGTTKLYADGKLLETFVTSGGKSVTRDVTVAKNCVLTTESSSSVSNTLKFKGILVFTGV